MYSDLHRLKLELGEYCQARRSSPEWTTLSMVELFIERWIAQQKVRVLDEIDAEVSRLATTTERDPACAALVDKIDKLSFDQLLQLGAMVVAELEARHAAMVPRA